MTCKEQFEAWWAALALKGDPYRRPYLVREAFEAGYGRARADAIAALETSAPLPDAEVKARLAALEDHLAHTKPRSYDRR